MRGLFFLRLSAEERQQLSRIESKLDRLLNMETHQMIDTAALIAEVTRETDLTKSILAVVSNLTTQISTLSQQLKDAIAANDPAALAKVQADLDAAVASLKANDDQIAAAVTANTPAAPEA